MAYSDKAMARWWTSLSAGWISFLTIALQPVVVVLVIAIALVLWLSFSSPSATQGNAAFQAFLLAITSVMSGVLGAVIERRWSRLTQGSLLVTRGKSAVRGLKLLTLGINAAGRRAEQCLREPVQSSEAVNVLRRGLGEVLSRCDELQDDALNAIEEWQEIIPEAAPRTEIGVISNLRHEVALLAEKAVELDKQLLDTKQSTDAERSGLQRQLEDVRTKLQKTQVALKTRQTSLGGSVLSGLDAIQYPPGYDAVNWLANIDFGRVESWTCHQCGRQNTAYRLRKGLEVLEVPDMCAGCGTRRDDRGRRKGTAAPARQK